MGIVILGTVTYAYTRHWVQTSLITFIHHGVFLFVFYFHERIWLRCRLVKFRSIAKMFTYETILGNVILGLITYLITGNVKQMGLITITYISIKHIVYVWNEFIWREELNMDFVRKISVKLFYKGFDKMGIKPNQLTVLNFLTNSLTAVVFFARGLPRLGLLFCIMGGIIDYIDGTLARRKFGGNTEKGKWLDTSLDWLYYLLLIGGIGYGVGHMSIGIICIVATVFSNYIDTQRPSISLGYFPFSPVIFIVGGAIINQMTLCLYLMTFFAILRSSLLWRASWKKV